MTTEQAFAASREALRDALDRVDATWMHAAADLLEQAWRRGRKVFVCGNGGSAANASHFAEDAADVMDRAGAPPLRILSLASCASRLTALGNDFGFESVFERQLASLAEPQDLLIAISGSGRSENVLRAVRWATAHDVATLGIVGFDGGELASLVDVVVCVPSQNMGVLEAAHIFLLDFLAKELRRRGHGVDPAER